MKKHLHLNKLFVLGAMATLIISIGLSRFSYTPVFPIMQRDISTFIIADVGLVALFNFLGYFLGSIALVFTKLDKQSYNYLYIYL